MTAHDRLAANPTGPAAKVDFVTTYHVVIESTLGVTQDPKLGIVYVSGLDCLNLGGIGMTFALAPAGSSQIFYQQGLTFLPGLAGTDTSGGALIVNVPVGASELTATVTALGRDIGQFPVFVRAGGVTVVEALPK